MAQHPHNMGNLPDMIQSADVYDCFDGNTVEVELMLEYLEAHSMSPRHIYREVRIPTDSGSSMRGAIADFAPALPPPRGGG